jgi:predicted nucleic acid-binding protein
VKVLLDTSVLVAATVEAHPSHDVALPWLQKARSGEITGLVAAHSLAEFYAVLTTLPIEPRITPTIARELITHNVLGALEIVYLSGEDYIAVISHLADLGISGGATYDALIMHAASKASVERVVTLDEKDFRRVYPELADRIVTP